MEQLEDRRLMVADLVSFLTTEHVDINVTGGASPWAIGPQNSDQVPAIQYANDEALMYVGAPSEMTRPSSSQFDFIGVGAGESFYVLPQNQNSDLLYLGFAGYGLDNSLDVYDPAAESKGRVSGSVRWSKTTLTDLRHFNPDGTVGDGEFSLWQSGSFGGSTVFMSSYDDGVSNPDANGLDVTDGISSDDVLWTLVGGHSHFNFGFTAPGRYEVDVKLSAYIGSDGNNSTPNTAGYSESDDITLYFSVMSVGELQFEQSSYSVDEDAGTASIDVVRTGGSDGRITVEYATADGSAQQPSDYASTNGTLEFLDGETRKTITIPIVDDAAGESDETFSITLSTPGPANMNGYLVDVEGDANGLLAATTIATITIVDNDQPENNPPTISDIEDQFTTENTSTPAIAFTVGDDQTAAAALVVTATSSDTTVVPNGNITLGGSGADRTITILPATEEVGATTITVTVTDESGLQASDNFLVSVSANRLVPFALPEYHGGEFSDGSYGQVTGDFNDDGNVDLIVGGNGENALTYMQGNGDGTFQLEQLLNADSGAYAQGVTGVDYDGDGDTDVLVYESNYATLREGADEGTITLYRNDGDANFTREVVFDGLIVGYWIDAGDLNGDGRADVVYGANRYDFETRVSTIEKAVLLQQTDGTLGEKTVLTDEYAGDLIMEDVDGDGHLDIVSTGSVFDSTTFTSTAYLQIFAGNGDGTFDEPQDVNSNAAPNIHQVIDLNGDGLKDLLVYDRGADSHVGYYPQQADGSFGERITLTPGYLYSQLNVAADINGDGLPDIVSYGYSGGYKVVWSPNLGGGVFGDSILLSSNVSNGGLLVADVDNDSYPDIINAGSVSATRPTPISVFINKTGEDPMVLVPPAARTRIGGDPIDLQVYFGFPIEVTGTPRIALQVGENTVYADYVSGSGTPFLDFRYTVAETDIDLDGVQLASNLIDLNGGTLTDPIGGDAVLEFPNLAFDGVFVNAVGPLVEMVSRVDSTPTDAATVRFTVQFSEDVTDVDVSDFSVRMTEGDLAGATVDSVTAISASEYEVAVSTGTGSGALGLTVNDSANIHDLESHILARGYKGGEVYTVRQQPIDDVDTYYTNGHADYRPTYENGEFTYIINPDDSLLPEPTYPSDEVITYLDSTAVVARGGDENYDFLGVAAGEPIYISDSSGSVASVPYLGWEGGSLPRDVFADYRPTSDPRVTSSSMREYVKVQMVGFRSSSDGDFSMYSGSTPTVWMATSDGITISDDDTSDAFWLYPGAHLHRNVAFTKPGTYEIDVVVNGYLDSNASDSLEDTDVYVESGIKTLVFHVDTLGARNDAFVVVDGNTLNGNVTTNDDWHEGKGTFVATVETEPAHGTVTLQEDGTFTYEPTATFEGTDSFQYRLTNPRGGFTTATVNLSSSHSPVAFDDSYSTSEDETLTVGGPGVLGNDVDPDGDTLKTAVVSGPENGSLTLNPDGSFTYVPDPDFNGTDSFTYTTTDVRYEVTALGTLGGNNSYALDVNNLNQVTGNSSIVSGSSNPLHAFQWTSGSMEDLGVVDGTGSNNFSRGYAINDSGVVVGESDNSTPKVFRWENGVIVNLGTLGGSSAVAHDINNQGEIVGSSSNGTASKPFIYVDGAMLELPTIAGNAASTGKAWGISPDGRFIVGLSRANDAEFITHATMWQRQTDGSYVEVDMGALMDEHNYSYAYAVNNDGTAVGASVVGTVSPTSSTSLYHGFVYHDGEMHDVGTLGYHPSYVHSELKDINATGQFVGSVSWFYNYPSFGAAAVLGEMVDGETAMIDLSHLVDQGSDWTFQSAEGINDGRSIVGYGKFDGFTRAYLLTPVTPDDDDTVFGNAATVTINVAAQADAPVTEDDEYFVKEGETVHGNVLFNDTDADGDPLSAELADTAMMGTLEFSPDGSFSYTPAASFDGLDSFTYTVSDGTGNTTVGTVFINAALETTFETVLSQGHADIGVAFGEHDHGDDDDDGHDHDHGSGAEEPEWNLHIHDEENDVEYGPADALLYVGMDAQTTRSGNAADPAYDFLGVDNGDTFYVLPETQNTELLFLGLGGEELLPGLLVGDVANLQLLSVSGPGHFSVWQAGPTPTTPNIIMSTADGVGDGDSFDVTAGSHSHVNFGFSALGLYAVTFAASGVDSDGHATSSEPATFYFQVGNYVEALDVQGTQAQRSFVRDIDLVFGQDDNLADLLADGRIEVTKYDLDGGSGMAVDPSTFTTSATDNLLSLDFGEQGIGGNRNSSAADGYYRIGVDIDGDGDSDVFQHFYRLLGDVNGDRKVNTLDRLLVMRKTAASGQSVDVNGDGAVNAIDIALVSRSLGNELDGDLPLDD